MHGRGVRRAGGKHSFIKTSESVEQDATAEWTMPTVRFEPDGYASANTPFRMPDGSQLVLTTGCDVARTGEVFCDDPIAPDVLTDNPMEDALAWLR